jgi:hypothetical protein
MFADPFLASYLVMLYFQILDIFNEIRFETYQEAGSLDQYLLGTTFLSFVYFLPLFILQLGQRWGYYVGFLPAFMAIGNGIARIYGAAKNKNFKGSKGLSYFNGFFLTLTGIWVILSILSAL